MNRPMRCCAFVLLCGLLAGCGVPRSGGTNAVPDSLRSMEEAAEDIIDYAPRGGWDKIAADVSAVAAAQTAYQPPAGGDAAAQTAHAALPGLAAQLQTASAAKDAPATMQAANDLSAAVIDLIAVYNPQVPADIGRLDVLERQVILDLAANDAAAAAASLAKAKAIWAKVIPSVAEHNGKEIQAQFEASLAAQLAALQAGDAAAVTTEARNALELVDGLEKLY